MYLDFKPATINIEKMTKKEKETMVLAWIRETYAKHHREIFIGETASNPEFVIVPFNRQKQEKE